MTVEATGEGTSLADRKRIAGQRLVIGFEKPYVDDDLRKLIRSVRPAGFILFARNVEEPAQVLELNRELASLVDPHYPALLCVDQEGGRVQRVRALDDLIKVTEADFTYVAIQSSGVKRPLPPL